MNAPSVLVVDDERRYRELLDMNLSRRGYRVRQAVDGLSALNAVEAEEPLSARNFLPRWLKSFATLALSTLPLVVAGVLLSSVLGASFGYLSTKGVVVAIVGIAFVATLVALPTFLEIPVALTLVAAGAPGAAVAVLIAGPVVNLPSLFVLARETSPRLAALLFVAVWLLASLCGICLT